MLSTLKERQDINENIFEKNEEKEIFKKLFEKINDIPEYLRPTKNEVILVVKEYIATVNEKTNEYSKLLEAILIDDDISTDESKILLSLVNNILRQNLRITIKELVEKSLINNIIIDENTKIKINFSRHTIIIKKEYGNDNIKNIVWYISKTKRSIKVDISILKIEDYIDLPVMDLIIRARFDKIYKRENPKGKMI